MPTELDTFPPQLVYTLMLFWSDADWFWRFAHFSPYVVHFDAPFIRCWMMQTLCSFIARMCSVYISSHSSDTDWVVHLYLFAGRMCFVSGLTSFDADHVSCYPSAGYKYFLFRCFLRRMLALSDALFFDAHYFIRCWGNQMFRSFVHRLYVFWFIVLIRRSGLVLIWLKRRRVYHTNSLPHL